MEYLVDGVTFSYSYQELKDKYNDFCLKSDADFISELKEALHLACFICFVKEVPTYVCLSDKGIIHELIHLLHIPDGNTSTLTEIRELFKISLLLS